MTTDAPCCTEHIEGVGKCCDPLDCEPCCPRCPTCPVLHNMRGAGSLPRSSR